MKSAGQTEQTDRGKERQSVRMVVSDLDGTLLHSDQSISDRTMKALAQLEKIGILFVIATARAKRHVQDMLPLDFGNFYSVFYNGAEIYHGQELICRKYLDAGVVRTIVTGFTADYPKANLSLEISNHLYTNFDLRIFKGWVPPYTQVEFSSFEFRPAAKILVDLRGIADVDALAAQLPGSAKMLVTDGGTLGQIAHKEVSKINGVKFLADMFGFGLEEVVAFGDDYNDMDMISECGIGVAMANAPQDVRDQADTVAPSNDEDGVAVVLERLFKF
jgi:5-amino-6-(5-phospho-D-ribitylamino)uracil phosphatase